MSQKSIGLLLLITILFFTSGSLLPKHEKKDKSDMKIEFVKHESEKRVDILVDGRLFTSYRWHDPIFQNIMKPVLYPVLTS